MALESRLDGRPILQPTKRSAGRTLRRALEDQLSADGPAVERRERTTADDATSRRLEYLGYV